MSTVSQMGIPGVGNGIFMPKLKNRWRVTFVNLLDRVKAIQQMYQ